MNDTEMTPSEELLEHFFAEELTPEQATLLLEMLKKDPRIVGRVFDGLWLEALLRQSHKEIEFEASKDEIEPVMWDETPEFDIDLLRLHRTVKEQVLRLAADPSLYLELKKETLRPLLRQWYRHLLWIAPILLFVLLFAGLSLNALFRQNTSFPSAPIAVMTDKTEVVWKNAQSVAEPGKPLYSRSLQFESGTVELLFFNGVRGIVEGPADLVLLNDKEIFCRYGTISMTVPTRGSGFAIQTPHAVIRDIGTEFVTLVSEKESRVHVVKGEVEIDNTAVGKVSLKTNEGAAVLIDQSISSFAAEVGRFVSVPKMRKRSKNSQNIGLRDTVRTPSLPESLFNIRFDEKGASEGIRPIGGIREKGCLPETQAFCFKNPNDRIEIDLPFKSNTLTLVTRIRLDILNNRSNPLLMSRGTGEGGFLWHISPEGELVFEVRRKAGTHPERFVSPTVFTAYELSRWVQLAVVLDGSRKSLTLYQEGCPVFMAKLKPAAISLQKVDLGNWKLWELNDKGDGFYQSLGGAVDELLIFDRPLSHQEIRALYNEIPVLDDDDL